MPNYYPTQAVYEAARVMLEKQIAADDAERMRVAQFRNSLDVMTRRRRE